MNIIDTVRVTKRKLSNGRILFIVYASDDKICINRKICSIIWSENNGFKIRKYYKDQFEVAMLLSNICFINSVYSILDLPADTWNGMTFSINWEKHYLEYMINSIFKGGIVK